MKRTSIALVVGLLGMLCMMLVPVAQAAPVAPQLQISITPSHGTLMPGQLALVHVGGGYPLEVSGTLDGQPLTFFWGNDGYISLIAIDLDAQPATHQLNVTALEPGSGRTASFQGNLNVEADTYIREYITLSGRLADLLDPAVNQAEIETLAQVVAPVSHRLQWSRSFIFPAITKVTSLYGSHRTYLNNSLEGRHTGVDFRLSEGAPVYTAAAGRVAAADQFDVRGNMVLIDHGWGIYTQYAHMSAIDVAVGDEVEQGQQIGKAGRTGRSTGTHLHWEVIVNGVSVDPLAWMALSPNYLQPVIDDSAVRADS